jgi:hypothetical protein
MSSADDRRDAETPDPERDDAHDRESGASKKSLWRIVADDWNRSSFWEIIRDAYLLFDRRTLGFTRILVGFLFLMDVVHRGSVWQDMYSTIGVLPTHLNLQRPLAHGNWSIFNAFETPPELVALWLVIFVTFFCLMVGYKTKLAQILSLVFVVSMNGRVLLIENGGYVVHNLLAMWTCFLPMGDRFSVDAVIASMKRRREATADDLNDRSDDIPHEKLAPHLSILGIVLVIQVSAIYFFNVLHKTGPAWKNGTAVHYVLYVDRMVTPIVAQVRDHLPNWFKIILTKTTIGFESALAFTLFCPLARVWARRLSIAMINALHIGFGTAMILGPFAWACCMFSTLFFSKEDWDIAAATMRRTHRARTVVYDKDSAAALLVCRLLKRLDRFELLRFRAEENVECGLRAEDTAGRESTWVDAIADIVGALPLGPAIAWIFRVPGFRHLTMAVLTWVETRDMSTTFGLRLPARATVAPPRPALRRGLDWCLAGVREVGIVAMFAGALNQAAVELWVINRRVRVPQPEPLRTLALKLRFLQGWFMFSPNPVMDDGTIVVDAITVDDRHIDPFTGRPPNFDLGSVKSFGYSQIWCDYFNRMHLPANTGYREAMRQYMFRLPQRSRRAEDALKSGEVYWVQDMNPRWNEKKSYRHERLKLFSFDDKGVTSAPTNKPGTKGAATPRTPRPLATPSDAKPKE